MQMIKNQNRAYWFGASDTSMIMGNWDTQSFLDWWFVKLGFYSNNRKSWKMDCGNILEIPIIREIERQECYRIKIGKHPYYTWSLRLRCNYDGLTKDYVIEIKTTGKMFAKVPKNYWQQCQVLMFRKRRSKAILYAYQMTDDDYANPYFPNIDYNRIKSFVIDYDKDFIEKEYKPRLKYLARCLREKKVPSKTEYEQIYSKQSL